MPFFLSSDEMAKSTYKKPQKFIKFENDKTGEIYDYIMTRELVEGPSAS